MTNWKVQHWLDDDEDATDNEYEAITVKLALGCISSTGKPVICWARWTALKLGVIDCLGDRTPIENHQMAVSHLETYSH
jgi:hypothetical protein